MKTLRIIIIGLAAAGVVASVTAAAEVRSPGTRLLILAAEVCWCASVGIMVGLVTRRR